SGAALQSRYDRDPEGGEPPDRDSTRALSRLELHPEPAARAEMFAGVVRDPHLEHALAVVEDVTSADRERGLPAVNADSARDHRPARLRWLRQRGSGQSGRCAGARVLANLPKVEVELLEA